MALDPTTFRTQFPEFTDQSVFPDALITFWDGVVTNLLNPTRWGANLPVGEALFVAHHLAISARDQAAANVGGIPGEVQAPKSGKSVGGISVSLDTGAVTVNDNEFAKFCNMTSYGLRFLALSRLTGAGGVQIGIGSGVAGPMGGYYPYLGF